VGSISIPFASGPLFASNLAFLFAIPPFPVGIFFGTCRPRTRRSLWRLVLAEAITVAVASVCIVLDVYGGIGTGGFVFPILALATFAWPAAFVGGAGRIRYDARLGRREQAHHGSPSG
jgi:hypothetical protein